jgi:hypothetical protein
MVKVTPEISSGQNIKDENHPFLARVLVTVMLLIIVFAIAIIISYLNKIFIFAEPQTYQDCIKKPGSIIQESYPEICTTLNGKKFVRKLTAEEIKALESPLNQKNQENPEGQFCGGVIGTLCPQGYICKLSGNHPDASGLCQKSQ